MLIERLWRARAHFDASLRLGGPRLWPGLAWAWRLLGEGLEPPTRRARRWRLVLRTLAMPLASARWFSFLEHVYGLRSGLLAGAVLQQAHRPFYDARLTAVQRVALLMEHELFISGRLAPAVRQTLDQGRTVKIAQVHLKAGGAAALQLSREDRFMKEGALVLALEHEGDVLLSLAFTIGRRRGLHTAYVGCVQATRRDTVSALREMTRSLHGLQPRIVLVHALRMLCRQWGVDSIEAVAAEHHAYRTIWHRHKKTVRGEYDKLWEMLLGERNENGNYLLPRDPVAKPIEAYPANERAQRRRRAQMLEAIEAELAASLGALSPGLGTSGIARPMMDAGL